MQDYENNNYESNSYETNNNESNNYEVSNSESDNYENSNNEMTAGNEEKIPDTNTNANTGLHAESSENGEKITIINTNTDTGLHENFSVDAEAPADYSAAAGQREQIYQQNYGYDPQQNLSQQNYSYDSQQDSNPQNYGYDSQQDLSQQNYSYDPQQDSNPQNYGYGSQQDSNPQNYGYGSQQDSNPQNYGYDSQYDNYNANNYNNSYMPQEPAKKTGKKRGKQILAGAMAAVVCFGFGFGGGALAINLMGSGAGSAVGGTTTISMDANTVSTLNAAAAISEKVLPSVVGITTTQQVSQETFFGVQTGMATGLGTGIIVSPDGYILTNSHVIGDGEANTIKVDTYDGGEYDGKVLWYNTTLDLAIVKIEASGLTAAELGDSDTVSIGDYAIAIGNPIKMNYERSVSQGIISGLNRTVNATNSATGTTSLMEGLIQTDAAINSGNSGGPLINSQGQVIGINSVKAGSAESLGFAIPINTAVPIVQEIIENGTYENAYIGINGISVSDILEANYKLDANAQKGVYIRQIYTQSPASEAGLREGDIITAVDGEEIESMTTIKQIMAKHKPGDVISVTYERDRQTQTVSVTLGKSDSTASMIPNTDNNSSNSGSNGYYYGGNGSGGNSGNNGYYYYYGY